MSNESFYREDRESLNEPDVFVGVEDLKLYFEADACMNNVTNEVD